jgi:hypothetical protein
VQKPSPAPNSLPPASDRDEPLAEIEEMIARLSALRDRERDPILRGSYQAAINRLQALASRRKVKPETLTLRNDLLSKLDAIAADTGQSRSALIKQGIAHVLRSAA